MPRGRGRGRGACCPDRSPVRSLRGSIAPSVRSRQRSNSPPVDTDSSFENDMMPIHNTMNMGNVGTPYPAQDDRPSFCATLLKFWIAIVVTCLVTLYVSNVKHINYFSPQEVRQAEVPELKDDIQKVIKARDETAKMVEEIHKIFHEREAKTHPIIAPKAKKTCEPKDRWKTDCIGKPDYALESSGASIITTRNTVNFDNGAKVRFLGWALCGTLPGARAMLQPDNMPGECWAFEGCEGTAVIRLVSSIYINCVSIEHVSKAISPFNDVSSAPKLFRIYGLCYLDEPEGLFLGEFTYDIEGPPIQCFHVTKRTNTPVLFLEVKFLSNNGNPEYTCVYKIRVHGDKKKANVIR